MTLCEGIKVKTIVMSNRCEGCFSAQVSGCIEHITIVAEFTPGEVYFVRLKDHFGNIYIVEIEADAYGQIIIPDGGDIPEGLFQMQGKSFTVEVFTDEALEDVVLFESEEGVFHDCIYAEVAYSSEHNATIIPGPAHPCGMPPTDFCERVKQCAPALISEDEGNSLSTGSDGGLYAATGGGGQPFDCSDLEQCSNFTDVRDTANSALAGLADKADSSSLATVATTGAYSDLSGLPVIPTVPTLVSAFTNDVGYITSAGLITLQPLVTYYDLAGHTGDTNATIVLSFQVNANQWLANGRYAINVETQKTGAGQADYTIYLNTSATIGGIPVAAFNSTQNAHRWMRNFTVKPGFIRYTTGLPAQTTDWQNGSFANAQTTEAALNRNQTLFFVCVIQNGAAGVNSSYLTINIRAV